MEVFSREPTKEQHIAGFIVSAMIALIVIVMVWNIMVMGRSCGTLHKRNSIENNGRAIENDSIREFYGDDE